MSLFAEVAGIKADIVSLSQVIAAIPAGTAFDPAPIEAEIAAITDRVTTLETNVGSPSDVPPADPVVDPSTPDETPAA